MNNSAKDIMDSVLKIENEAFQIACTGLGMNNAVGGSITAAVMVRLQQRFRMFLKMQMEHMTQEEQDHVWGLADDVTEEVNRNLVAAGRDPVEL